MASQQILVSHGIDADILSGYFITTQALMREGLNYIARLQCIDTSCNQTEVSIVVNMGNITCIIVTKKQGSI